MYFKAKYIIINKDQPIIFPETYAHADMALWIAGAHWRDAVTSAGFVSVSSEGGYRCYGESVSLRIKSNGEADDRILNKYLGGKQDEEY